VQVASERLKGSPIVEAFLSPDKIYGNVPISFVVSIGIKRVPVLSVFRK
jgi:hypothetical protein